MIFAAWVAVGAVVLVLEFAAILRGQGETLSEITWRAMRRNRLVWWAVAGFLLWLAAHLLSFGRFP